MSDTLLKVEHLVKYFNAQEHIIKKSSGNVKAVDDISFEITKGEIFALVGESGCGKSTTARLILKLIEPTSGKVYFEGTDLYSLPSNELRTRRKDMQMIFQDPYSSMNPRWKIGKILAEPLETHNIGTRKEQVEKVKEMLKIVGLNEDAYYRYPHEFSGGQRQRIGIARALITNPKLVICDEPISALDVSIQAQIINLLKDLQEKFQLTYLFITHDLRVVNFLCDNVGVMYLGKLVEVASKYNIYNNPAHPYTKALFSAIPIPDPENEKNVIELEGDVPSPLNPPSGCRFHTRCQHAMEICSQEEPAMKIIDEDHKCACHLYK